MSVGDRIRQLREQKKLSQKEVALIVCIDRSQYSRIGTNKVEPTISTMAKIAEAFDVKLAHFFTDEEPADINSFDKSLAEKVKMIDELKPLQKSHIMGAIDMAINNKRLKDTLSNALSLAQ